MQSFAYKNIDAPYTIHQEENKPVVTVYFPYGVDWKSNAHSVADELYWVLEESARPVFVVVDILETSLVNKDVPIVSDYVSQTKWLHHKNLHKVMIIAHDDSVRQTIESLQQQSWAQRIACV